MSTLFSHFILYKNKYWKYSPYSNATNIKPILTYTNHSNQNTYHVIVKKIKYLVKEIIYSVINSIIEYLRKLHHLNACFVIIIVTQLTIKILHADIFYLFTKSKPNKCNRIILLIIFIHLS